MSDIDKRRLVFSIIQFLTREMASDDMSEDAKESMEVASQCIQTAFAFSVDDVHLEVCKPLEQIFKEATHDEPVRLQSFNYSVEFFNALNKPKECRNYRLHNIAFVNKGV